MQPLRHVDGTACSASDCAWTGDGGHEVIVHTQGALEVRIEPSLNIVLVDGLKRYTITDVQGLTDALFWSRSLVALMEL
jgi:hypothetical protein